MGIALAGRLKAAGHRITAGAAPADPSWRLAFHPALTWQRARGSGSAGRWPEYGRAGGASFRGAQWAGCASLPCAVTGVLFASDTA